jgi:GT2 family glycosyltransferase
MKRQTFDIIIINYNSTEYTIRCVDSIYRSSHDFTIRIIVVDNCSKDGPKAIQRRFPEVSVIYCQKNLGFAKAVNLALKRTMQPFVVLLNPDTLINEGFFETIFHFCKDNEEVAIVGPKIYEHDGSVQGSARKFPSALTSIFGRKSPLTKFFPNNPITKREFVCFNGTESGPKEVDWVSGACMIISKAAIRTASADSMKRFFLYWEDADLCRRLKLIKDGRSFTILKAQIYHHTGKSSDTQPYISIYHFHRSCCYYFIKHAEWPTRLLKFRS